LIGIRVVSKLIRIMSKMIIPDGLRH